MQGGYPMVREGNPEKGICDIPDIRQNLGG